MTRTEAKRRLELLQQKFEELQSEAQDLKDAMDETIEEIEPYEGKDDLTPEQEARQEWFESQSSALDDLIDLYMDLDF